MEVLGETLEMEHFSSFPPEIRRGVPRSGTGVV